jgi:predicted permease
MREVIERVRHLPGVTAAGLTSNLPVSKRFSQSFRIEGKTLGPDEKGPYALTREISPGYLETMRIPLVAGRALAEQDSPEAPLAVVVNEALVARYFPGANANAVVGTRVRPGCGDDPKTCPFRTIVGVIGNVREAANEEAPAPSMYAAIAQRPWVNVAIAIRTSQDPLALMSALRTEVRAVDQEQPIYDPLPMEIRTEQRLGPQRFALQVLVIFAVTALILAAVGLYGVTSYLVTQRTREFGIRLALGAEAGDILGMVLRKSLTLTGLGLGLGLLASLALSRVMASLIYGVSAQDPLTLAIAVPVLAAAALLASFFPARRATRVPPAIALRAE